MPGTLAHSPGDILRRVIIDLGLGIDPETNASENTWPVYAEGESDKPDTAITVRTTVGVAGPRMMINGEYNDADGVQVRIRAGNHTTGWVKAKAVDQALCALSLKTISFGSASYLVWSLSRSGTINPLGNEPGNKRKLFTINYLMMVEQR